MILIHDNLPCDTNVEQDGNIEFIHENYVYNIGTLEGVLWISRQTVEDYRNGLDNYERIERWIPEDSKNFTLLRGEHF